MRHLGFTTYFVFSAMCVFAGVFVHWFLPETKGVALEDMETLFSFETYSSPEVCLDAFDEDTIDAELRPGTL